MKNEMRDHSSHWGPGCPFYRLDVNVPINLVYLTATRHGHLEAR